MRTLLKRERSRADRSGTGFSLIKFVPRDTDDPQQTLVTLARILQRRLRSTDEVGWLDGREIGAILACTPVSGAYRVAYEVCRRFGELTPPRCEVYCYPSDTNTDDSQERSETVGRHESQEPPAVIESLMARPVSLAKRLVDIVGAGMALVLSVPLTLVIALAVKLTSPGPVFFKQLRAGLGGRPFYMYKFRTMRSDAELLRDQLLEHNEIDGPVFKIKNDPRVTTVGRLLRRTSMDELPQLWNVLKGEMSLVGPRPLPCHESAACAAWQKERLNVTPGLTCTWQVAGRSDVSFEEWMRMDVNYVEHGSFAKDLKILVATVPAVLFGEGAY